MLVLAMSAPVFADGKVVPPRDYKGSLEERAQEAIIIFHASETPGEAKEDLILKIRVVGQADRFAWVVPLPSEPQIGKEDPKLFTELFAYVEARKRQERKSDGMKGAKSAPAAVDSQPVEVLSRQTVGEFDVAVVRENEAGGLNPWLEKEGYQPLAGAEDVLDFYRQKGYVYACMKVSGEALAKGGEVESHPLRFTFSTGGRDGIFFPMKLTGLQSESFDVNLYVLYGAWLNDKLSKFGYQHRGFSLRYRDWDTPQCAANAGKSYSLPTADPFLASFVGQLPTVTALCQKLHPGEKYYLTNIQAYGLKPSDVRAWSDDLWLFPYYNNRSMVPHDVRSGGVASAAWPGEHADFVSQVDHSPMDLPFGLFLWEVVKWPLVVSIVLTIAALLFLLRRRRVAVHS